MADVAISNPRPDFLVDGSDNPALGTRLLECTITNRLGEPSRCTARFSNWGENGGSLGYLYSDRQVLDFGKKFTVTHDGVILFDGRIGGLEAFFPEANVPSFCVTAFDRLNDLGMVRRTRTFENVAASDLVNHIAAEHGLTPQVDFSSSSHKQLAQINQTDLVFLSERLQAAGVWMWVEDSTLHAARERRAAANAQLLTLAGNLREFAAKADLSSQRSGIVVSGWDVAAKQAFAEAAHVNALAGQPIDGIIGATLVSAVSGERKETIVDAGVQTVDEARQHAESAYLRLARHFVVGRGIATVDDRLQAGTYVNITNVDRFAAGVYFLTEVRHVFDAERGLRSEFTAERASLGPV